MILQFIITKQNETINLPRGIHSQEFIFRRAIVMLGSSFPNVTLGGGVSIDLQFMNGFDFISNGMGEKLFIPLDLTGTKRVFDHRFEFNFNAEDVRQAFTTRVLDFNGNLMTFDNNGLEKVILFFEFNSLDPYVSNY